MWFLYTWHFQTQYIFIVVTYKDRGSTVYTCFLDAEGAFDVIPHYRPILFQKAMGVLPDHCWHIMINWYSNLNVQIKCCGKYSTKINIHVGTRQGGLSSPYLFNLFYQELIDLLSKCTGGILLTNRWKFIQRVLLCRWSSPNKPQCDWITKSHQ